MTTLPPEVRDRAARAVHDVIERGLSNYAIVDAVATVLAEHQAEQEAAERAERRKHLDELVRDAEEHGLYEKTAEPLHVMELREKLAQEHQAEQEQYCHHCDSKIDRCSAEHYGYGFTCRLPSGHAWPHHDDSGGYWDTRGQLGPLPRNGSRIVSTDEHGNVTATARSWLNSEQDEQEDGPTWPNLLKALDDLGDGQVRIARAAGLTDGLYGVDRVVAHVEKLRDKLAQVERERDGLLGGLAHNQDALRDERNELLGIVDKFRALAQRRLHERDRARAALRRLVELVNNHDPHYGTWNDAWDAAATEVNSWRDEEES